METLYVIIAFILGLLWGSFMNVVVIRGVSLKALWGHSQCDHCHKDLKWYDLFPIFSFIALKGKCRYCGKSVSIKNLVGEVFTGLAFAFTLKLILSSSLMTSGIVILILYILVFLYLSLYDIWHLEIPLPGVILLMLLGLIFNIYSYIWEESLISKGWFLTVIVPILLILAISKMYKRQVFGAGDYIIMTAVALTLGASSLFVAFESAITIAAITSLIIVALLKVDMKQYKVPLVPFLFLGWFVGYLWGVEVWNWIILN